MKHTIIWFSLKKESSQNITDFYNILRVVTEGRSFLHVIFERTTTSFPSSLHPDWSDRRMNFKIEFDDHEYLQINSYLEFNYNNAAGPDF